MSFTRRRMRTRTLVMWALMISVLFAFLIIGCAKERATAVVERRDIVAYLPLRGETAVPAASMAEIVSPYEAPVDTIYVTVGQVVKKGDVIMELSAPQTEVRYQQARQQVQQARLALERARKSYQASLSDAKQELAQAQQAEKQARQQAKAQGQQTPSGGVQVTITPQNNPQLSAAIQRRRQAQQGVIDAQAEMDEGLIAYERQLATAQQNFEQVQAGLKVASIRTPITGTVLSINTEIGQTVKPDQKQPLAVVVDLEAVKVYAGVDRNKVDLIKHGDPAVVTINALPKTRFQGQLQQVYTERVGLLKGEQFVAVIGFKNKQGLAKPGMKATALVQTGRADDVPAVPAEAVYRVKGKTAVKIREGKQWRSRIVETGVSDGRYTEIRSGLEEGDVVLVNP